MQREWIVLEHFGELWTVRERLSGESWGDWVPSGNHCAQVVAICGDRSEAETFAANKRAECAGTKR